MLQQADITREVISSMKKELSFVYITTDGKVFLNEKKAKRHERKILKATQK